MENLTKAKEKLEKYGQSHVLRFFDELGENEKEALVEQILMTDFEVLRTLQNSGSATAKGQIAPIEAMPLFEIEENKAEYLELGKKTIQEHKVGAVLLAGGMGTRLGSDDPKGVYNIGLTKEVYIFQRLIENLMDVVEETGTWIDLYVMTSDKNDKKTRSFLKEKNYFGYKEDHVFFFQQEIAPAVDYEGKIYMESKSRMATSPNGNGGWFVSLMNSPVGDRVKSEGIEWLNVFAVDNVLQRIADPCFIGATLSKNCKVGAKVVRKSAPDEKVGVMCLEDGKPSIVEYYELTDEMMNTKDKNGDPAYNFGVILNYLFEVKELQNIVDISLPLHRVEKKINHVDAEGKEVKPEAPNGYKFEALVLDMIHEMKSCLPYEVVREYEFAPIKNKTGVDSVESARALCQKNGIEL